MSEPNFTKLNIKSLIGMALQHWDSDTFWCAIQEMQMRGAPETLHATDTLAKSQNWRKRALAMYIASQLRQPLIGAKFGSIEYALEATQATLLTGLSDRHDEVVQAAISGFGHRPHPSALPNLIRFAQHSNKNIRFAVAVALGRYNEPESIEALLQLATDDDDDVRNWATFAIGSMHDADSPKIRKILWQNLHDKHAAVRGEALVGLAERKDDRIVAELLKSLDESCQVYQLNAAQLLGSPLLLDRLNAIKAAVTDEHEFDSYWYGCLSDAIESCSGFTHSDFHKVQA